MNASLKIIQGSFYNFTSGNDQRIICAAPDNNRALVNSTKVNI